MIKRIFLLIFLGLLSVSAHAAGSSSSGAGTKNTASAKDNEQPNTVSVEKILAAMDPAERSYYFQAFDYSMLSVKPGQKYDWKSYNSNGYFEMDAAFIRNDTICRNFREFISLREVYSISSEGIGCKRVGRDGWCKLKKDGMATCALEPPSNPLDEAIQSATDMKNNAQRNINTKERKAENTFDSWWPF